MPSLSARSAFAPSSSSASAAKSAAGFPRAESSWGGGLPPPVVLVNRPISICLSKEAGRELVLSGVEPRVRKGRRGVVARAEEEVQREHGIRDVNVSIIGDVGGV